VRGAAPAAAPLSTSGSLPRLGSRGEASSFACDVICDHKCAGPRGRHVKCHIAGPFPERGFGAITPRVITAVLYGEDLIMLFGGVRGGDGQARSGLKPAMGVLVERRTGMRPGSRARRMDAKTGIFFTPKQPDGITSVTAHGTGCCADSLRREQRPPISIAWVRMALSLDTPRKFVEEARCRKLPRCARV